MKALVGAFNQKKALIRAFSVIVITDGSFAALFKMFKSSAVRTISQQAAVRNVSLWRPVTTQFNCELGFCDNLMINSAIKQLGHSPYITAPVQSRSSLMNLLEVESGAAVWRNNNRTSEYVIRSSHSLEVVCHKPFTSKPFYSGYSVLGWFVQYSIRTLFYTESEEFF